MSVAQAVKRRISPLPGIMSGRDYRRVFKVKRWTQGETSVCGYKVTFSDRGGFIHSVEEVFKGQGYKFATSREQPIIVDVGANIGLSVLYFKREHPRARVIAIEADPSMFNLLQKNISVNRLTDVEAHNCAAWFENTTLNFFSEGSLAGSSEIDVAGKGKIRLIEAKRLKEMLPPGPIDFLKVDIEGSETKVLRDIKDDLARVDHLFFEYHSIKEQPQTLHDLLSLVTGAGFRYAITTQHVSEEPFISEAAGAFDLQINVFCYRRQN